MQHLIRKSRFIFLVFGMLACCFEAVAGDVTLAWDAVSATDLAGYKVYYGTSSGVYLSPITVPGTQTSYTVTSSHFQPGQFYYFAVTAIDSLGNESGFSNEVSKMIPTCDMNNDTSVNILDLQKLINIILGLSSPSDAFDLNGDGTINILELQTLSNVVLGLRSCP
jgi:hypothetical protein